MTSIYSWLMIFVLTFVATIVIVYFLVKFITASKTFEFMVVNKKENSGTAIKNSLDYQELAGREGLASTDLRLSGKARFDNKEFQVISRDEYIQKGTAITVNHIEGNKIFVIKKDKDDL